MIHVLKYGVGLVVLVLLIRSGILSPALMGQSLRRAPEYLAFGFAIYAVQNSLAALRWGLLLRGAGVRQKAVRVVRLHFVGVFFSALLPGGTAGDLVKGFYLFRGDDAEASAHAIASLVMDRITGMLGLLLLTAAAGWLHFSAWSGNAYLLTLEIAVAAVLAGVGLVLALSLKADTPKLRPLFDWVRRWPGGGFAADAARALAVYRGQGGLLALALLLSLVVHSLLALVYLVCAIALGMSLPPGLHLMAAPLCTLLNGMPLAPAGLGVGEAFGDWLYAHLGASSGSELLGLVHGVVFAMAMLSSLAYVFERRS